MKLTFMPSLKRVFSLALGFVFLLSACSPKNPTPTVVPTLTPYFTKTPTIAVPPTSAPTLTLVPTETPAATLSPTPGPVPGADFNQAKLIRQGFAPGVNYFLVFELLEPFTGSVYGVIDQNKKYTCEVEARNLLQVRCTGWLPGVDRWKNITIYDTATGAQLFEQRFYIPMY